MPHGLPAIPTILTLYARCVSAFGGHAVGDMILLESLNHAFTGSITVSADATNIYAQLGNASDGPYTLHSRDGTVTVIQLVPSYFRLVVVAQVPVRGPKGDVGDPSEKGDTGATGPAPDTSAFVTSPSGTVKSFWSGTQAAYDALGSKVATTLYLIVG